MLALLLTLAPEAEACGMYYAKKEMVMAEVEVARGELVMGDLSSLEDIFGIIDEEPESATDAFQRLAPPVENKAPDLDYEQTAPLS